MVKQLVHHYLVRVVWERGKNVSVLRANSPWERESDVCSRTDTLRYIVKRGMKVLLLEPVENLLRVDITSWGIE